MRATLLLAAGPIYAKYNAVLRAKSKDPYLVSIAKALCKGNNYATSIHATNSCVLKLSKLTKACKVWRGIKDAKLPKAFWVPNEMGVRGGIEYGFSSTTTDKDQALHYAAGGGDGKSGDAMTIFEMQMGMVDRGADLSWLSQYPHEREVLLPPLTGVEALSSDVEGSMLVIHSRLSLNLSAQTLEQVSRAHACLNPLLSTHLPSLDWTGLDWTGLDWTGLDWTGLDWAGLDWAGLDWTGLGFTALDRTGLYWTGLDWTGSTGPCDHLRRCSHAGARC